MLSSSSLGNNAPHRVHCSEDYQESFGPVHNNMNYLFQRVWKKFAKTHENKPCEILPLNLNAMQLVSWECSEQRLNEFLMQSPCICRRDGVLDTPVVIIGFFKVWTLSTLDGNHCNLFQYVWVRCNCLWGNLNGFIRN